MKEKKLLYDPIMFALILNAAALAVSLFVYRPFFETNDDAIFALLSEGAFGSCDARIICANTVLGYVYMGLHTVIPGIRWHSVLQYFFMFIAYTSLTYIIQAMLRDKDNDDRGRSGRFVAVLVVLSTFYESYVSLQFSKTAVITAACGYLLLMYALRQRRRERKGNGAERMGSIRILTAAAYVLLIYGMILRSASFKLATLLMLPLGLYEFVVLISDERRFSAGVAVFVAAFLCAAGIFAAAETFNRISYEGDKEWNSFRTYHSETVKLIDREYTFLDYDRYSDELNSLGISENDTVMLLTWQFGDDDVWNTEEMTRILSRAPAKRVNVQVLKRLVENIYNDLLVFSPCVLGMFFVICIMTSVFGGTGKGRLSVIICWLAIVTGIFVYYQYSGRWSHRVVYSVLLVLIPAFVYHLAPCGRDERHRMADADIGRLMPGIIAMSAIVCFSSFLGNIFDYNDYRRGSQDYQAFIESIGDDKNTLYVADTFTFQDMDRYSVLSPYVEGSLDNFVTVGSWYVNSPVTKRITGRFGYDNPFDALVGGAGAGNVILVDNRSVKEKQTYLSEHYGEFDFVELPEKNGFRMYSVRSRDN